MKKLVTLLLITLGIMLLFCACGSSDSDSSANKEDPNKLSENEEALLNYLIQITGEDFFEPAAVRILDIGDYEERSKNENNELFKDMDWGPDTIVLKLQGENKLGGTVNHYYKICLTTTRNTTRYAKTHIDTYDCDLKLGALKGDQYAVSKAISNKMKYVGTAGEYVELPDSYSFTNKTDVYSIAKLNKAFAKHWEDLGIK